MSYNEESLFEPARARRGFLDLVYGVLFSPRSTMREFVEKPPWGAALGLFVVVDAFVSWTALRSLSVAYEGLEALGSFMVVFAVLIARLGLWVVGVSVLHFVAELFGGRGRALALLAATGFAATPRVFSAPLLLLFPGSWAVSAISLGLGAWVLVLYGMAVSGTQGLPGNRAAAVIVVPVVSLAAATFIATALVLIPFVVYLSNAGGLTGL